MSLLSPNQRVCWGIAPPRSRDAVLCYDGIERACCSLVPIPDRVRKILVNKIKTR
jgi:hypothetical protein